MTFVNPNKTIELSYEYDAAGTKYGDLNTDRFITILNKDNKTDTMIGCTNGNTVCSGSSYTYVNNATVYSYLDMFGKGEYTLLLKSLTLGRDNHMNPAKVLDVHQLGFGDVMNLYKYEYYE